MKKFVLVIVTVILIATTLISCNQNVCPAYVLENDTQQTENNG
ncbi:MAG TPA: hypothetical protein VHI78_00245 [Bacteroidales bacterium]|jgi:hypothetical protein|nr:hypothetical protein [Bacteroidales bacterium]